MRRRLKKQPAGQAGPAARQMPDPASSGGAGPPKRPCSSKCGRLGEASLPGLVCLLLAAVTLTVFWPTTRCDFINLDDEDYFSGNPRVLSGLKLGSVLWAFGTGLGGNWHPVTWLSYMLDATLFGPGPRGPHLVNLLLHVVNGVLVFVVLRRMTGALWRSAVAAALFALHPLRVESVAWVTERKDVLSGLFFLLTLWAYARFVRKAESRKQKAETGGGFLSSVLCPLSSGQYWLSLLFFALGLMSKPMLVTVPFVLLLLDYWPLERMRSAECGVRSAEDRSQNSESRMRNADPGARGTVQGRALSWMNLILEKGPFFLLSAVFCVVTFKAQVHAEAVTDWVALPLGGRIQNALVSYARYLGKTFWPVDLAINYPLRSHWPWGAVALAAVLVAGLCFGALWYRRQRPYLLTGWFWWFGTLIPVIGLVQAGNQAMADRYTYLPAIGLLTGLVWGAGELARLGRVPRVLAGIGVVAVLIAGGLRTADQLRYWRDSETLFGHALAGTADNFVAHNCLGLALAAQGKWAEAIPHYQQALNINPDLAGAHSDLADALYSLGKWDEAIAQYEQALKSNPNLAKAHNNFGLVLSQKGQWDEAIQHYGQALISNPNLAGARKNLADALYALGKWDEAIRHYEQALKSDPNLAQAHNNFGVVLGRKGRWADAIQHYQQALKSDPKLAEAHNNLGVALGQNGQWEAAIVHYQKALDLQPENADTHYGFGLALARTGQWDEAIAHYRKALVIKPGALSPQEKLAWLLATCPQAALRNGTQALGLAREVDRLSGGNNPNYLDTLAAAYAEAGQFPEAVEAAGRALALAVAQTNAQVEEIRARLKLYQAGSPYHEPAPNQ